jgi:putative nucleotidyltransferase with HDIG domain
MEKLQEELKTMLSDKLTADLVRSIEGRGVRAFLVGGTVRDLLMSRLGYDIDLVLDGDVMETARSFARVSGGAFITMDEEHQIARVVVDKTRVFDFALLRGTIDEDLALRDFPINSMALSLPEGRFHDPLRGIDDVNGRLLRLASDRSFTDDPLRMVRAFRLALELGFSIDCSVFEGINHHAPLIHLVSKERVRDELFRILRLTSFPTIVAMADCGLLFQLFPVLEAQKDLEQGDYHHLDLWHHTLLTLKMLEDLLRSPHLLGPHIPAPLGEYLGGILAGERDRRANLKLCALLHDVGKPLCRKEDMGRVSFISHEREGARIVGRVLEQYRMSAKEIEFQCRLVEHHLLPLHLARSRIEHKGRSYRQFFRKAGEESPAVLLLSWGDIEASRGPLNGPDAVARHHMMTLELLDLYFSRSPLAKPPRLLSGDDIKHELGIPQGEMVGKILADLEEASALGEVVTRDDALAMASRILTTGMGGE